LTVRRPATQVNPKGARRCQAYATALPRPRLGHGTGEEPISAVYAHATCSRSFRGTDLPSWCCRQFRAATDHLRPKRRAPKAHGKYRLPNASHLGPGLLLTYIRRQAKPSVISEIDIESTLFTFIRAASQLLTPPHFGPPLRWTHLSPMFVRTVAKWNADPALIPPSEFQRILDTKLAQASDEEKHVLNCC